MIKLNSGMVLELNDLITLEGNKVMCNTNGMMICIGMIKDSDFSWFKKTCRPVTEIVFVANNHSDYLPSELCPFWEHNVFSVKQIYSFMDDFNALNDDDKYDFIEAALDAGIR